MIDLIMAIKGIDPAAEVTVRGSGELIWNDGNPNGITTEQITKKQAELQVVYDNDYARKRRAEYPSIEECVHAMLDDGLVELQEKRAAVKAKYPKGGSA